MGHARWQAGLDTRGITVNASANVFLDDFLLFDVSKPITDMSHLEIEKSTIDGRPYQTGGGRTVDANVIDILITWMVNRDREFLQGGATGATSLAPRPSRILLGPTPNCKPSLRVSTLPLPRVKSGP